MTEKVRFRPSVDTFQVAVDSSETSSHAPAGKYSNGFCHWPQCAWRHADGTWQPASANFTSLATPNAVGSGKTALATLLHEGARRGGSARPPNLMGHPLLPQAHDQAMRHNQLPVIRNRGLSMHTHVITV